MRVRDIRFVDRHTRGNLVFLVTDIATVVLSMLFARRPGEHRRQ